MNTTTPLPPIQAAAESLWTVDQVATYLGCTVRHVYNLIGAGLPHLYLGRLLRFEGGEVRAYLLKTRVVRVA
jgi:excisionase family DNA binding protein